jgi:hypothetical protein
VLSADERQGAGGEGSVEPSKAEKRDKEERQRSAG